MGHVCVCGSCLCVSVCVTEGDAANNAVPSNMKVAGAGNKALGVLSGLLSVLSLLHGIRGKGEGEGPEDCSSHYR